MIIIFLEIIKVFYIYIYNYFLNNVCEEIHFGYANFLTSIVVV
jgi:hypothetical protein